MALDVLFLEDDPAKKARLLDFLGKSKDLFSSIDSALCTDEARTRLKAKKYDLFVVDVVVPIQLGQERSEENSIALLEAIEDGRDGLIAPAHVLPVSSSSELTVTAHDFFRGRPWGIVPYTDSAPTSLETIERVARYILSVKSRQSKTRQVDVFLITALMEPEFAALEKLGLQWEAFEPLDGSQLIRYGELKIGESTVKLGAAFSARMGPVASAVLTAKAALKLSPRLIIMAGICAGVPGKAAIGDVIAAEVSWDWQSGKFVDKGGEEAFEIAPHQLSIKQTAKNQLVLLKRDDRFWASLSGAALHAKQGRAPRLIFGPMATGASVLADSRVVERLKQQQNKNLVGLDMETYAVFAAAEACDPEISVLSLKAVCDNGDLKKSDEFQAYAADVSAATVIHFLENYAGPLIS